MFLAFADISVAAAGKFGLFGTREKGTGGDYA